MKKIGKNGSIFIYILLLINIVFVIGIIVFNSSFSIANNISIGQNSQEMSASIYNKGNIAIDSVKKYNGNGSGFLDVISCPTNVTMSGSVFSGSVIPTKMVLDTGSFYCSGKYRDNEFRIYYDSNFKNFVKSYYSGDVVDIWSDIKIGTENVALNSTLSGTLEFLGNKNNVINGNNKDVGYLSFAPPFGRPKIFFDLGIEKNVGLIKIYKNKDFFSWNFGKIKLYDSSYNLINDFYLTNLRYKDILNIDIKYFGLLNKIKYVLVEGPRLGDMEIKEIEMYEVELNGENQYWVGKRKFHDDDSTLISFDSNGIGGGDLFDDNFNSDNYKVTSIGNTYYPNNYEDDDVVPRKIIFGNVSPGKNFSNIFWNNYKTNDFIDKNSNNNDNINKKIGDVEKGSLHLDLYNLSQTLYDLKILEFDRTSYKNKFTLLPLKTNIGKDLKNYLGYIQNNNGVLSLSKNKTGNEYIFDFKNKDYGIFLINKSNGNLAYRLRGETEFGTGIYLNPINDSGTGTIEVMANNIMIGGEKNFIGENFVVSGLK